MNQNSEEDTIPWFIPNWLRMISSSEKDTNCQVGETERVRKRKRQNYMHTYRVYLLEKHRQAYRITDRQTRS